MSRLMRGLGLRSCVGAVVCDRVLGVGRSSLQHLRSASVDSGCETKFGDRPAKHRLLQHPGICGSIFEVICPKIKLASHLETFFMSMVQINVPNEVLISLKESPETISQELSILAAVKLFELGKLSSGRAAQLAGMSRVEFLNTLGQYRVSPFTLTVEELEHDIDNA
jgi:predicted HTH domain antitoxin